MRRVLVVLLAVFTALILAALAVGRLIAGGEQLLYIVNAGFGPSRIILYDTIRGLAPNLAPGERFLSVPAWSPDGTKLAYITPVPPAQPGIAILDMTTGVTAHYATAYPPQDGLAWSRDGTRLAYRTSQRGSPKLAVYDLSSGESHIVNLSGASDSPPLWSPDGASLLYISFRDGNPRLYAVAVNCEQSARGCRYNERLLLPTIVMRWPLSWSPDGEHLAFVRVRRDNWQLHLLSASCASLLDESCAPTLLPIGEALPFAAFPAWSPDGASLALTTTDGTQTTLNVIDMDSGRGRTVAAGLTSNDVPSWSPSGAHIALHAYANPWAHIIVLDAVSGAQRGVIEAPFGVYSPLWRPGSDW
jgi:TolB protein